MGFTLQPPRWEGQEADFRILHRSLNAPVIAIDELSVGPARAGIALCAEPSGSLRLQIAVRSVQTGQVIAYAPGSDLEDEDEAARALDAALSFAEGMGFLFDDEEASARSGDDFHSDWNELIGEAPLRERPADRDDTARAGEAPVVDLIHEVPVLTPLPESAPVAIPVGFSGPAGSSAESAAAGVLSKHRLVLRENRKRETAVAPAGDESMPSASIHPQDPRIRLFSRF